ncbi:hypothetical protein C1H46_045620 [Malus baccata]|uniref:Uncharacterized protein n=1 Tax=Malus baccata TaxID=106549 RepID=A0A540K3N7_MALBA|nr:hypothetical protein C1H46_045620 [Malus baccata]
MSNQMQGGLVWKTLSLFLQKIDQTIAYKYMLSAKFCSPPPYHSTAHSAVYFHHSTPFAATLGEEEVLMWHPSEKEDLMLQATCNHWSSKSSFFLSF